MTRPVKNYKRPTEVSLEVLLYAILDVVGASGVLVIATFLQTDSLDLYLCHFCNFGVVYHPDVCDCFYYWHRNKE